VRERRVEMSFASRKKRAREREGAHCQLGARSNTHNEIIKVLRHAARLIRAAGFSGFPFD